MLQKLFISEKFNLSCSSKNPEKNYSTVLNIDDDDDNSNNNNNNNNKCFLDSKSAY